MIRITEKQLESFNACSSGLAWFKAQKQRTLKPIISALLKDSYFNYATWLLPRLMTHPQKVLWAIQNAELVIDIYERQHPTDKRPREAIEAAKAWLKAPTEENRKKAYAAAYAAYAANAAAGTAYAANAAAYAANAANAAAYAVAYAAADAVAYAANAAYAAYAVAYAAADAVAYAANAADAAAYAERKKIERRICNKALRILGEIK